MEKIMHKFNVWCFSICFIHHLWSCTPLEIMAVLYVVQQSDLYSSNLRFVLIPTGVLHIVWNLHSIYLYVLQSHWHCPFAKYYIILFRLITFMIEVHCIVVLNHCLLPRLTLEKHRKPVTEAGFSTSWHALPMPQATLASVALMSLLFTLLFHLLNHVVYSTCPARFHTK